MPVLAISLASRALYQEQGVVSYLYSTYVGIFCSITLASAAHACQSAAQAVVMRDVSLITGDPAKLGLGAISLCYDVVLLVRPCLVVTNDYVPNSVKAEACCFFFFFFLT